MFIKGIQRIMKNKPIQNIIMKAPRDPSMTCREEDFFVVRDPRVFIEEPLKPEIDERIICPAG
jgi:hypothetical protein